MLQRYLVEEGFKVRWRGSDERLRPAFSAPLWVSTRSVFGTFCAHRRMDVILKQIDKIALSWSQRGIPYRFQLRLLKHFGEDFIIVDWASRDTTASVSKPSTAMRMARRLFATSQMGRGALVFCGSRTVPDRDGGLRDVALLGA